MNWNPELLEKSFTGKIFGRKIYYYPETGSTNDDAFSLGLAGAPEGTIVIADSQSKGKGRFQRIWVSPAGTNIYTSVILRPQFKSGKASCIPILAGVAAAETLHECCPGKIGLKWPNDLLMNGKKVCGILSQARISGEEIDFIVLGTGMNVNIRYRQFPEEIRDAATSLMMETGRAFSRQELLISLYENMEKWYKKFLEKGFDSVKEKWLELTPMIGQKIRVAFKDETIEGKATGIDDDGRLILLGCNNENIKISSGDATILKR